MFATFVTLQLKRALRMLPFVLLGAMLLLTLTASIAFLASKALYGDSLIGGLNLGVVRNTQNTAEKLMIDALAQQDTLKDLVKFHDTTEAEGKQDLETGRIQGMLLIPEGFVSGIIDGTNNPAVFLLNQNAPLESRLIRVLSEAGAKTLSTSQAALYAMNDIYQKTGRSASEIDQMIDRVNEVFLQLSLSRDQAFRLETVSSTGDVPALLYFAASMVVLFLLLMGMMDAFLLKPLHEGLQKKLDIAGIGEFLRLLIDWLIVSLVHFLLLVGITLLFNSIAGRVGLTPLALQPASIAELLFLSLSVSAFIIAVYSLNKERVSAMLMLFGLSFGMLFLSGGFIPTSFLPASVRALQFLLPTTYWMKFLSDFLTNQAKFLNLFIVTLITFLFILVGYFGRRQARKRGVR